MEGNRTVGVRLILDEPEQLPKAIALKPVDIITSESRHPLSTDNGLMNAEKALYSEDQLELTIQRNGKSVTAKVRKNM